MVIPSAGRKESDNHHPGKPVQKTGWGIYVIIKMKNYESAVY
jgi:hypothetical protein